MRGISSKATLRTAVVGGVAIVVIGGASAMASIPSPNGTIYGCYANSTGATRIIDPGTQKCTSSEHPISWSQRGPRGPIGLTGLRGSRGPAGTDGTDGTDGVSGYQIVEKDNETLGPPFESGQILSFEDSVACPTGKQAVGGGGTFFLDNATSVLGPADVTASYPGRDGAEWDIAVSKLDGTYFSTDEQVDGQIYAVCVTATP